MFPLRNRQVRDNSKAYQSYNSTASNQQELVQKQLEQQYAAIEEGDDEGLYREWQRQHYEQNCKVFFILRDQFLLTKVSVTGTIVFQIRKDDRFFFGVDDSTGVLTCVLWLNEGGSFGNKGGKNGDFRKWLTEKEIGQGSVLTILGQLEYYKDKV